MSDFTLNLPNEFTIHFPDEELEKIISELKDGIIQDLISGDMELFERIRDHVSNNMMYNVVKETSNIHEKIMIMIYWMMELGGY